MPAHTNNFPKLHNAMWPGLVGKGSPGGEPTIDLDAMLGQTTEDEVFISAEAVARGVEIENTGSEPLVGLRYFGPDVHPSLPKVGDYKKS